MVDFHFEKIAESCAEFGAELDREKTERLSIYGNLLLSWNEKMNLTAITDPEEVLYKHFYDCILFLKHITPEMGESLIDVGTGAGFPGMVLKIMRPDIKVTLLDSLNKRLVFLNDVIEKTGLQGVCTVHMRAEDAGKSPVHREKYGIACARAVAAMPVLMEYCLPLVKKGGMFVAMKGASAKEETDSAQNAARLLGAEKPTIICETLTGNEHRAFVTAKKISQTPTKYPRKPAEISKQPL
ncbi:MAG: 16S rRNA (guanine(527)-N(7))-methyltransferase RsmG [Acutalibacteraceae bacterium]